MALEIYCQFLSKEVVPVSTAISDVQWCAFYHIKKKVQKYRSSSGRTVVAASMLFPPTLNSLQSSLQNRLDCHLFPYSSLMAQTVRGPPAMPETRVQSLVWEESLEKEMATHCSTLAWKIPRMEEPGRPQSMGSQRVGQD